MRFGPDGLVPAVVQDAADGRVLMLAWMDAEALAATLATGDVHFHSRSRDRLWRKGETSGNVLRLVDLAVDCDGDALLVTVDPVGPDLPPRHALCFDPDDAPAERTTQGFAWLETLWATIASRAAERPAGSYTTACSTAASTRSAARSPRRPPRSSSPPRTTPTDVGTDRTHPRRPSPARPPTCCTTPSSCSRSAACRRRTSSTRSARATAR